MRLGTLALAALAVLFILSFLRSPQPATAMQMYTGCSSGEIVPVINVAYEQEVVNLTNAIRQQHGLPPLRRSTRLDNAARYHATDMGQDDYYEHDSYDRYNGQLVWTCGTWDRLSAYYDHRGGAENIFEGPTTPREAMDGWMNSPGHRANILHPDLSEIGVGYYEHPVTGQRYWVQDFANPGDHHPSAPQPSPHEPAQPYPAPSATTQNHYDGYWEGSSSLGTGVAFHVTNGQVHTVGTITQSGSPGHTCQNGLAFRSSAHAPFSGTFFSWQNTFATMGNNSSFHVEVQGTFTGSHTASGTIVYTFNIPALQCSRVEGTWQATKR